MSCGCSFRNTHPTKSPQNLGPKTHREKEQTHILVRQPRECTAELDGQDSLDASSSPVFSRERFIAHRKHSKRLKKTHKDSQRLKKTQKAGLKKTQKDSKRLKKTQKDSKRLKKTQKDSKRLKKTQKDSKRLKKIFAYVFPVKPRRVHLSIWLRKIMLNASLNPSHRSPALLEAQAHSHLCSPTSFAG